jgi:hypothetical protein
MKKKVFSHPPFIHPSHNHGAQSIFLFGKKNLKFGKKINHCDAPMFLGSYFNGLGRIISLFIKIHFGI